MIFNNPYWNMTTKIQMLENWILVQCYLYYKLNISVVDDYTYDNNAKQLNKMLNRYPKEAEKTEYSYAFKDYDPSTGYDLYDRLFDKEQIKIKSRGDQIKYLIDQGRIKTI